MTKRALRRGLGGLLVAAALLPLPILPPMIAAACSGCACCGADCRCGTGCAGCSAGRRGHGGAPLLAAAGAVGPGRDACRCPAATLRAAPEADGAAFLGGHLAWVAPPVACRWSSSAHRLPFQAADLAPSRPRAPPAPRPHA